MSNPVEKEWRRLQGLVRRRGPKEASAQVCKLIAEKRYPTYLSYRYSEYLLKKGEYALAGTLLNTVRKSGVTHPLMDELYSSWLWCSGKRRAAVAFAKRSAMRWQKSYLFSHLAALHSINKETKRARRYFRIANSLADQELSK